VLLLFRELFIFNLKLFLGGLDGFVLVDAFLPGEHGHLRVHLWSLEQSADLAPIFLALVVVHKLLLQHLQLLQRLPRPFIILAGRGVLLGQVLETEVDVDV